MGVFDRGLKTPELFKTMHGEGENIWSGRMRNHDSWPGAPTKSMVADSQHCMQLLSSRAFFFFFTFIWECCCSVRWRVVRRWFLISSTCVKCGALLGSCILKHFSRYCPDYFLLKSCTNEKFCNAKKQAFFIINIIARDYDCRRWVICTMMQLV